MVACLSCGRPIDPQSSVCPSCNRYNDWTEEMERRAGQRRRMRRIAPLLSAFVPGLGQFFQRRPGAALFHLITPIFLAFLVVLLWKEEEGMTWGFWSVVATFPILWAVNILDAFRPYTPPRPPCQGLCPITLDIPGYQSLIAEGRFREAYALIHQKLPFVGTCGRICVAPCQSRCSPWLREGMAIRDLKRFVADVERKSGGPTLPIPRPTSAQVNDRVAVVGGGPAGLTAAHFLARDGVRVTLYEATEACGGMLRSAIPRYRLPLAILEEEIRDTLAQGIDLVTGVVVGRDLPVEELLKSGHRAVFLATGAPRSMPMRIAGEEKTGVMSGIAFLQAVNAGRPPDLGKVAVVVGGGNVAVDAARTAHRLGVEKVVLAYRRTIDEMPAHPEEIAEARREGIPIMILVAPRSIIGEERVKGIELTRMGLGSPDSAGRRRPVPIESSEFVFPCDSVIVAVGQRPDATVLTGLSGLATRKDGSVIVGGNGRVRGKVRCLYAGGDFARGAASFIEAVADGRRAYFSIMRQLGRKASFPGDWEVESARAFSPDPGTPRVACPTVPMRKRAGFSEVVIGYSWEEATREARRCLRCNKGY
jgi:NADPH-dependent glutamate synthase beta subunit-like oxidoreductase